jgi:hypothetical protein
MSNNASTVVDAKDTKEDKVGGKSVWEDTIGVQAKLG